MEEKSAPTHRTTSRILDIIEYVSQRPGGSSLAQISRDLDIPKGSLHPLTVTLTERKYLSHKRREGRFYPGESLFIYGNKHVNESDLLERIRTVLLRVNEKTQETLYFGVLSGLDVLYLIKMDTHSRFRVISNPGSKLPAYSTGYGKALLSQYSRSEIEEFYPAGSLTGVTEHTLRSVAELNDQLDLVRDSGFAYEKEESTLGIRCIGVSIEVEGQVLAGISIAVPLFRYTPQREGEFKQLMNEAKHTIEEIIASQPAAWIYGTGVEHHA